MKKIYKLSNETSTLLNRNYYIKVGKADALLKEIGIMTKEGKIKNDKIRKYNQIDHYVELLDEMLNKLPKNTNFKNIRLWMWKILFILCIKLLSYRSKKNKMSFYRS